MNELALFAGGGGGILGGKLLNWRTVCAVEHDPYARDILVARQNDGCLPPFPIWDDVCTFDGRPWRGIVNVVSGGFPCQDISSMGTGAGILGERSGLWSHMARIIDEIRPEDAIMENSPLLISRGLALVLSDLAKMGYDARWGIVGAHHAGGPHARNRIWIVAHSNRRKHRTQPHGGTLGRMGRQHKPVPWDRSWEVALREFRGMDDGMAYRMDRTNCIRNGQVPAVVPLAWDILSGRADVQCRGIK